MKIPIPHTVNTYRLRADKRPATGWNKAGVLIPAHRASSGSTPEGSLACIGAIAIMGGWQHSVQAVIQTGHSV